jgi:TetR/AcrR family transcriptional regulator, transcriptional repressor for nem operon
VKNGLTRERILDAAERLVQTRGYNAFSYADISGEIGITNASLHYHFPKKGTLGTFLIRRYAERFERALAEIDEEEDDPRAKLQAYVKLYETVLRQGCMCLCGMLAADSETLPAEMRNQLKRFFDGNEQWLAVVLDKGRKAKQFEFSGRPTEHARLLVGSLEGAMLVARSYAEISRFTSAAGRLLASMETESRRASRQRKPAPR